MAAPSLLPLRLLRVGKRFGAERALADVTLDLARGELCVLLGENGAGKSTLLGIVSTLVAPTSGAIEYGMLGRAVRGEAGAALRRGIGLVAHEPLVYGDLTAAENLALFARLYDVGDGGRRAYLLLDRFGLAHVAGRPVRTFSRGMQQRLALCRALLHAPELLLLDEPFTGLDVEGSATLVATLVEERARGAALLLTTHDVAPVAALCDHLALLRRGRLAVDERAPAGRFTNDQLRALQARPVAPASAR